MVNTLHPCKHCHINVESNKEGTVQGNAVPAGSNVCPPGSNCEKNGSSTEPPLGFSMSRLQRGLVEINVDAFRLLVVINRFETEVLPKAGLLEPAVRRLR